MVLDAAGGVCVRCRSAAGAVQVREAVYCEKCYTRVFNEKTRASLELARGAILLQSVVEPWAKEEDGPPPALAVAFSGGVASCVLLHAVASALQSNHQPYVPARAPEFARIDVLFVEGEMAAADAQALAARIAPKATFVPLSLDSVYDEGSVDCTLEPHGARILADAPHARAADDLSALLHALYPDTTPRTGVAAARTRADDLRALFLHRVLRTAAAERQCAALLYGHSAPRTAALLLENLAKGAGHKLPIESAPSQWWAGEREVLIVHPLRTHLAEELAFYAAVHGFGDDAPPRDLAYEANADKSSIGSLTQSLVDSLQHGVSSTVSTIQGTGAKLVYRPDTLWPTEAAAAAPPPDTPYPRIGAKGEGLVRLARDAHRYDPYAEPHICPLCTYPAQRGAAQWRAERSVTTRDAAPPPPADALDLRTRLCYSCLQILDVPESPARAACTVALPAYVLAATRPHARHARPARTADTSPMPAPDPEPHVPGGRATHAPQPVSRAAMAASLAPYLL